MNAPGCSLREMGSRPERRMGHPAPEMEHPGWRTCVHERAVEHPAPLMGHPERRSSHPEALMEHPGRNGAAVFRGKSVSGAPSALGLSLPFGFDNYAAFC